MIAPHETAEPDPGADPITLEVLAPGMRALVALDQGRLREAEDLATHAAAVEPTLEGARPFGIPALVARSLLALERDDLEAADALGDRLRQVATDLGHWIEVVSAYLLLAQVHHSYDDDARALDDIDQARELVREFRMNDVVGQRVDAAEAAVRIAAGDLEPAGAIVSRLGPGWREPLEARLRLARGEGVEAYACLDAAPEPATQPARIEREVLMALAAGVESERSGHHIGRALAAAEPEGFRRTVLGGGLAPRHRATVRDLIVAASGRTRSDYALGLVRGSEPHARPARPRGATSGVALVDPLTPAEQRVLFYLASSLTVAELARQLGVSPNTVKSQMKSIYRKLAVGSRDAAIERARELGLR